MNAIPNSSFPLKRIVLILLTVAGIFSAMALFLPKAADAKDAIGLSPVQTSQVKQAQKYLNAISTMRSKFMQVTNLGQFAQGLFSMERPGLMRIEYDPPVPVLIVSNGLLVMYKDMELEQRSYVPLSSTPASIFIGERVDFFKDDLMITDYALEKGALSITLQRTEDPLEGSLTLVFETKPMSLKKWITKDAQGVSTTVALLGPEFGVEFNPAQFKIENNPVK